MSRISNDLKHGSTAFRYALAKGFQKAAYYGFRAVLVLFLMDQMELERTDSLSWYAMFTGAYLVFQLIGALISDLLAKNRKLMLIGAAIQVCAFLLMAVFEDLWMLGVALIVLGGALFSMITIAVNIGAFLGIVIIGHLYETVNHNMAMGLCSVLIGAAGLLMMNKNSADELVGFNSRSSELLDDDLIDSSLVKVAKSSTKFYWIAGLVLCVAFYYFSIPLSDELFYIQTSVQESYSLAGAIGFYISIPFGVLLTVFWSFNYSGQYFKMLIGIFVFLAFYVLLQNSEYLFGGNDGIFLFVFFTAIYECSNLFIAPLIYSLITEHSNPRYHATFYAVSRIPERALTYLGLGAMVLADTSQVVGVAILVVLVAAAFFLYSRTGSRSNTPL